MTIGSVGEAAQSYLSRLFSTQKTQASSALSVDPPAEGGGDTAGAPASNSLTGGPASLNSQTMQALLDLTQQDRTDQAQQDSQIKARHNGYSLPQFLEDRAKTARAGEDGAKAPNSGAASAALAV